MVQKLILLNPQIFLDGLGLMTKAPTFLLRQGMKLLQAEWLRSSAGYAAYFDKPTYATPDAVKTGRIHTFLPGWAEANIGFIRSGGYSLSKRVSELSTAPFETVVLWGEQDEILERSYPQKLLKDAPGVKLVMVPRCGHTPHLEQPEFVADQVKLLMS